jgi:ferritin-like metal-binding protein YciE
MGDSDLQAKLADYVEDAHAMETNVLQMLGSRIATTSNAKIRAELERHKAQTERHEERLRGRLEKLGRGVSIRKETQSVIGALMKGVGDQVRGDKAGKNARDGFVTEHMEIAAYELLERLAERAGDTKTAAVARQNRRDEEAMAKKIASKWDTFLDLTLADAGIEAPRLKRSAGRSGGGARKPERTTTSKARAAARPAKDAGSSRAKKAGSRAKS